MNYFIASSEWYQAWREHVQMSRLFPEDTGHQKAAQISLAQHVMFLAEELVYRRTP